MAAVNARLLREEFDAAKARVKTLREAGKLSAEAEALFGVLITLMNVLIAVLLEKTTPKTSANSSIPPSQTDGVDDTAKGAGKGRRRRSADSDLMDADGFQTFVVEETSRVHDCEGCGADLEDVAPCGSERRILYDVEFRLVEHRVEAEIKLCPACRKRTKGQFPATMPGPVQYGRGIQALVISLLVAHMLSLNRAVALVETMTGRKLSEATCLEWIRRLDQALQPWKETAIERLLAAPALHADETGFRVDKKTHWIHILSDGTLTLKCLHRKRGTEALDDIGIVPRYTGVLIHDCWSTYFTYTGCRHGLCGAHLLRELAFVRQSGNFRWARLMMKLLRETCHRINISEAKALTDEEYRKVRTRYRTILTQGAKELPPIPKSQNKKRGRIAKPTAHNLHERMKKHETDALRFAIDPYTSFTNNVGERGLRMSKVKIKVSGCFRTIAYADRYCTISSYLQTAAALGYNTHTALEIALSGRAADILNEEPAPARG